ncbi:2,3-butanediol dehydrogenase [Bacillus sp. 165]|uniref:2,3-butanediol dehydrogenase n=1 Tax=Bacillus sp. 165 TaxID=1529117 RepID=UPI001FFE095E|nr:2,3-butanediol dehydrogenase [Bacillus sp. 165]
MKATEIQATKDSIVVENMKAAKFFGAKDIRVVDAPIPTVDANSVKVEIEWCGICGSDMHEYVAGPMVIPSGSNVTMGHEFSGRIVEIGENVTTFAIGDRVVIEPIVPCWTCNSCRTGNYQVCEKPQFYGLIVNDGGFGEYIVSSVDRVYKIPDTMSYEQAALVEPVAVVTQAIRSSQFKFGDTVAVFGTGPIGLLLIQSLKAAGASKIIAVEVVDHRREVALKSGATHAINPIDTNAVETIFGLTNGRGVDVAFDCAGVQPTFEASLNSVRNNGELKIISLWEKPVTFNPNVAMMTNKRISTTMTYNNIYPEVIDLINQGILKEDLIITKKIHLDDVVEEGFEEVLNDRSQVKILVTPKRSNL